MTPSLSRRMGFATPEGTAEFRRKAEAKGQVHAAHFRIAPGALHLSSIGLGTYLGRPDAPTDLAVEQAVGISLQSGRINVLDTAINYRYQRAERSVGRSLARLFDAGAVARAEVFVATKAGYLAPDGENPLAPRDWVEATLLRPGVLTPEDIVEGSHAMTPRYLSDQIDRSRTNLGLETIDLVYLHNASEAQAHVVGRAVFRERLRAAFAELERRRSEGALRAYGVATWDALRTPPTETSHLSLEELVSLARQVGGPEHGFRFVQFPFNLAMPEASTAEFQEVAGTRATLFAAAKQLGIGSFTSVPLMQGRLARPAEGGVSGATRALQFARAAPGTIAALVGQKTPAHLAENLSVASEPPWTAAQFEALLR